MDIDVDHRSQAGHRSGTTETGFPLPRGPADEHLCDASPGVAGLPSAVDALVDEGVLPVGLAAGDRPLLMLPRS